MEKWRCVHRGVISWCGDNARDQKRARSDGGSSSRTKAMLFFSLQARRKRRRISIVPHQCAVEICPVLRSSGIIGIGEPSAAIILRRARSGAHVSIHLYLQPNLIISAP